MKKVNLNALVAELSGGKIFIREAKNGNDVCETLREFYGDRVSILVGDIPATGTFLYSSYPLKGCKAIASGKTTKGEWFYVYD
jgi:hypothetical protein